MTAASGQPHLGGPIAILLQPDGTLEAWSDRLRRRVPLRPEDLLALAAIGRREPGATVGGPLADLGFVTTSDAVVETRPIFVFGAPRSGTTLVRKILDGHPRIACGNESMFMTGLLELYKCGRLRRPLLNLGVEDRDIFALLRGFIEMVHGNYAHAQGKSRWADKTPQYALHADFIHDLFGDEAQYVVLVRHGLDVAASMAEMVERKHWDLTMANFAPDIAGSHALEIGARVWARMSDALHRFALRQRGKVFILKYEELVTAPAATVARLFGFLGEAVPERLLATLFDQPLNPGVLQLSQGDPKIAREKSISGASVGRWRRQPPEVVESVRDLVNPTLARWGYEPV